MIKGERFTKIGVIADTHLATFNDRIVKRLVLLLSETDAIIHAGDFTSRKFYQTLTGLKPLYSVWGNADEEELKELLHEKEFTTLEGYRIGIFHGHGQSRSTIDRVWEQFKDEEVDIIIFGHSHQPLVKTRNGILILNPGSINTKRQERWPSFIILELSSDHIEVNLKFLEL